MVFARLILKMMKVDNKVEPIDTESKQDVRPSTRKSIPSGKSDIYQEDEISSLHYFSWLSDVLPSIGAIAIGVLSLHITC